MNMLFSKDNKDLNLIEPDNVVYSVLYDSLQTKKVVSIELVSSNVEDVIGVPVEINENICKVFLVDEYGVYDGYALFDICDITQISVSSDEEKTIEKLMTNQGTVSVKTTPKKE